MCAQIKRGIKELLSKLGDSLFQSRSSFCTRVAQMQKVKVALCPVTLLPCFMLMMSVRATITIYNYSSYLGVVIVP